MNIAVILAAGKGVRMKSDLPKVFHKLRNKPLLSHVLDAVKKADFEEIYVVVGYKGDLLRDFYKNENIKFVEQKEQLGTAHAVMQVESFIRGKDARIVVLAGDMPLISGDTIKALLKQHYQTKASATVLSAKAENPFGYGRIIRNNNGEVLRIVEEKDATEDEKKIVEINTGIYCFENKDLLDVLRNVKTDNAQKELYLTDTISLMRNRNLPVFSCFASDPKEAVGINTKEQLEKLEKSLG